jgi:hypothetical protein
MTTTNNKKPRQQETTNTNNKELYSAIIKSMKTNPTVVQWHEINHINGYCHMTWKVRDFKLKMYIVNDYSYLCKGNTTTTTNNEGLTFPEWCDAAGFDPVLWNDCPSIQTTMLKAWRLGTMLKAWRLGEEPSEHVDNGSRIEAYLYNKDDCLLVSFGTICSLSPDDLTKPEWCAGHIGECVDGQIESFISDITGLKLMFQG